MNRELVRVPLHSRKHPNLVALIDGDDWDLVQEFKWHPMEDGDTFYAAAVMRIAGKRTMVRMHRYILGVWDPAVQVAHDNWDGLDNRRSNLWTGSVADVRAHTRNKPGTGQFRGVLRQSGRSTFTVRVSGFGHIGTFDDEELAARVYDLAAKEVLGPRALLNFPGEKPAPAIQSLWEQAKAGPQFKRPYRGLRWNGSRSKWEVRIRHAGKDQYLGLFDDPVQGAMAYDQAAKVLFGDRAILNFSGGAA